MKKMTLLTGMAVGYVLGTRAGRERYNQIMGQFQRVANDPRVKEKASQATTAVKQNAPVVKEKVAGAASSAKEMAQDKIGHGSSVDSSPASTTASATPYPAG
jgi:hypothetical protein